MLCWFGFFKVNNTIEGKPQHMFCYFFCFTHCEERSWQSDEQSHHQNQPHVPDQIFLVTFRRCLQSRLNEGLRKFILDT